jgi:hypothetical protein
MSCARSVRSPEFAVGKDRAALGVAAMSVSSTARAMTPLRTERSLFDFLVWVPGAFYVVAFAKALLFDPLGTWGSPLIAALIFLLIAAAHRSQSRRIAQLEQALLERRQPAAGASPAGGAGGGTRV